MKVLAQTKNCTLAKNLLNLSAVNLKQKQNVVYIKPKVIKNLLY